VGFARVKPLRSVSLPPRRSDAWFRRATNDDKPKPKAGRATESAVHFTRAADLDPDKPSCVDASALGARAQRRASGGYGGFIPAH
jgi:hypothetical protein